MTSDRLNSPTGVRHAYEAWHASLEFDEKVDAPWHRLLRRHLDPLRDLAGKAVLEIACGRGELACSFAAGLHRPAHVLAADFATTAVDKGRHFARAHGLRVGWQVADIQALPHRDATFDTVISCETIEHVPDPCRALGELARVLKRGGRLLVTTPNYLGGLGLYRAYLRLRGRRYTETGQPINRLMLLPLTAWWTARAGLRLTALDGIGHYLPYPGRPPISMPMFDRWRRLTRWFALHSIVVAEKP